MRHPVRILTVFPFCDSPKATGMTPAINGTGLLCVGPGGQRAEPAPFSEVLGRWTRGGSPPLGGSLCLRPQCFLGSTFVTNWQDVIRFHSPLHFSVRSLTNPLHANLMLACGLPVVPGWSTGVNPIRHIVSCTSVFSRVSTGQSGYPRCQEDLCASWDGPTAHRITQSPCCSPASHVSVLALPCACLGPGYCLTQRSTSAVHSPVFHKAHAGGLENWHF